MWDKIKAWFARSETIFWARLQVFIGALGQALTQVDLSPLLSAKALVVWQVLSAWLIASGVITEMLRRRNAKDLG